MHNSKTGDIRTPFSVVPTRLIEAILNKENTLSLTSQRIYCQIHFLSKKKGYCWSFNKDIASHLDISESTVKNHIKELTRTGFLENYQKALYKGSKRLLIPSDMIISNVDCKRIQDMINNEGFKATSNTKEPRFTCATFESNIEKRTDIGVGGSDSRPSSQVGGSDSGLPVAVLGSGTANKQKILNNNNIYIDDSNLCNYNISSFGSVLGKTYSSALKSNNKYNPNYKNQYLQSIVRLDQFFTQYSAYIKNNNSMYADKIDKLKETLLDFVSATPYPTVFANSLSKSMEIAGFKSSYQFMSIFGADTNTALA